MLRMSWSTFRDRWQLFAGAILTVSIGVALVQSSLLTLLSATAPTTPSGLSPSAEVALRDALAGAATLLAMIVGVSVFVAFFVAFFVVGSTFSFTVAQRSRELALLRLVGASGWQVRSLLLGEAALLGSLGTILGAVLGIPVLRFEVWMLKRMGFVPDGFMTEWRPWILLVSATTGIGVAAVGVAGASHRASRLRALEALRSTGRADRVMTPSRWVVGIVALAGATTMLALASTADGDPMALALPALFVAIVAMSTLSPLLVPLIGALLGLLARVSLPHSQIRELVHANLRDGVRRSASTAAPIIMFVGLIIGFTGTIGVVTDGAQLEASNVLEGDLIVSATDPVGPQVAAIEGVRTVSEEAPTRVRVDSPQSPSRFEVNAVAINPRPYAKTHRMEGIVGDLDLLQGDSVALDSDYASSLQVQLGDLVQLRLEGVDHTVQVVAIFPFTLSGAPVLFPIERAPLGDGPRRYVVQTDRPATTDRASEIEALLRGQVAADDPSTISVSVLDSWILSSLENQQRTGQRILLAVLGLVAVYVVIAIVNAVVIAASDRQVEFATGRLTGLSRGQVVGATLWESLLVVVIGVVPGGLAAAMTIAGASAAVSNIVGTRIISIPWLLMGAVTSGVIVLVSVSSVVTTLASTHQRPVHVAEGRR